MHACSSNLFTMIALAEISSVSYLHELLPCRLSSSTVDPTYIPMNTGVLVIDYCSRATALIDYYYYRREAPIPFHLPTHSG